MTTTTSIQTKGLTRNTIDKFYTKLEIVDLCLHEFSRHIQINPNTIFF